MPLRIRNGHWHYRFKVQGHEYTGDTGLVATERTRTAAMRIEAEARRLVLEGKASELRLRVEPFNEAADPFLAWCDGEYREHPNSATRIRTSFASLTEFFGRTAVSAITAGKVEDYKSWRRAMGIRDVTLRHDLHAMSLFMQYAEKQNWARENVVRKVEIPSDAEAERIHVITPAEEMLYFQKCQERFEVVENGKRVKVGPFPDLYDLGRLMLNQGCRPEEITSLPKAAIDLDRMTLKIAKGKSKAARRTLRLTPEAQSIVSRRIAANDSPWLFPSPKRKGKHILRLNKQHGYVLQATGLRFVIYDFRHTWTRRC